MTPACPALPRTRTVAPGFKYTVNAAGDTLHGWRTVTPREIYGTVTEQDINRVIGTLGTNWRPLDWVTLAPPSAWTTSAARIRSSAGSWSVRCPDTQHLGWKTDNRTAFGTYTFDAAVSANRTFSPAIEGRTTVGVQYNRSTFDRNGATGASCRPAPARWGPARSSRPEVNDESRTSAPTSSRMAFNDRLFLTGAVRSDRNSAFGADFKTVFYPKLSASWVISDESFFPAASG
jgi:hypothetical protein